MALAFNFTGFFNNLSFVICNASFNTPFANAVRICKRFSIKIQMELRK